METRTNTWFQTLDGFAPGLGSVLMGNRRRLQERTAIRKLHMLDDHVLKDLGILRSEIEAVVKSGRPAQGALWPPLARSL